MNRSVTPTILGRRPGVNSCPGLLTGAATILGPSLLGLMANPRTARAALAADIQQSVGACGITTGAGKIPFICFDLAGGGNIAGSNVLVGGPKGQLDFLSVAGYSKLGLPARWSPIRAPAETISTVLSDCAFIPTARICAA